jgi:hypothetical protein
MNKQVIVTVSPDGEVSIEAVGFKGSSCEKATKAIEQALGTSGKRSKKPEYYQGNTQQAKVGQ